MNNIFLIQSEKKNPFFAIFAGFFFIFGSDLCQNIAKNTAFYKVASGRIKPVKHMHMKNGR